MLAIIQGLLSFVSGPALQAYQKYLEAGQTREKLAAELAEKKLELDAQERVIQGKVLVAEQGNWATRWVRPMWAAPFVIWTWKVVVWDNVLGLGVTDALGQQAGQLCMVVAGSYFLGRSAETVARVVKGK